MDSKNYCPTCQKMVEYEFSHDEYFCSICGRTKKVAEEKIQYDKQRAKVKKTKIILKIIGIISLLFLFLWVWIIAPGRMKGALSRGLGYVTFIILIGIISGIFYGIRAIINRLRKSK